MLKVLLISTLGFIFIGCSHGGKKNVHGNIEPVYYAVASLERTKSNKAKGEIRFSEAFGKVKIQGEIKGLDKNATHGFHIHEYGDCTALDGTSGGGHYNPEGHKHSGRDSEKRHAGDLGNIQSDKNGVAKIDLEVDNISVSSGENPILGRGLIVHAQKDDEVSQPTGGAGARIACGVIGATKK